MGTELLKRILKKAGQGRLLTPQAFNSLLNLTEERLRRTRLAALPRAVAIEFSKRCNLSCLMCHRTGSYRGTDLEPALFGSLCDQILGRVQNLQLDGCGESLVHPRFQDFFRRITARSPRSTLDLTTNGLPLANTLTMEEILRLDILSISFNAATAETQARVMPGSDFDRVVETIRAVAEAKKRRASSTPLLVASFVAMRSNIHELPEFILLADRLGFETVSVSNMIVTYPEVAKESLFFDQDRADRYYPPGPTGSYPDRSAGGGVSRILVYGPSLRIGQPGAVRIVRQALADKLRRLPWGRPPLPPVRDRDHGLSEGILIL